MAITSPALTLSIEALFGNISPTLTAITRLGATDFSADAPNVEVKPGATIKVPVSSITAASAYNDSTNNYLTGGSTTWQSLTATHYLQGFDVSGVDIDSGVNATRIKQLFSIRAGKGIASAIQGSVKTALDATTASTGVTIPAVTTAVLKDYIGMGGSLSWLDKADSVLAVNGTELAQIRSVCASAHLAGDDEMIARFLGFKDMILVPGMTARAVIVPTGSAGFIARVPQVLARYAEAGAETDPDTGLSVGIIVADDQAKNRQIVNADIWFGVTTLSANAAATTAGIVKVGTTSAS